MIRIATKLKCFTQSFLRANSLTFEICKTKSVKFVRLPATINMSFYEPFGFSTQKQSEQEVRLQKKAETTTESLDKVFAEYRANSDNLKIIDHVNYFKRVFKTKEKINQGNVSWKILNSKLLQYIKRINYRDQVEILSLLSRARIDNALTRATQFQAFQRIDLAYPNTLERLLAHLNSKNVEIFSQQEQRYLKIYERLSNIFNIPKKKVQNELSLEGLAIIIQDQKGSIQKDQHVYKIKRITYQNLILGLIKAKIKKHYVINYILNNPFTNQYAKQNLESFQLQGLRINFYKLFSYYFYKGQEAKTTNYRVLKKPIIKILMSQILRKSKNSISGKYQRQIRNYISALFQYARLIRRSAFTRKIIPEEQLKQEIILFNKLKAQLIKSMNYLYQTRTAKQFQMNYSLKMLINLEDIQIHQQNIWKNFVSFALENASIVENQKLVLLFRSLIKMKLEDRKKLQQLQNKLLNQIWLNYPNFDSKSASLLSKFIRMSHRVHQVEIKVPENVKLVELKNQNSHQNEQKQQEQHIQTQINSIQEKEEQAKK